MGYYYKFYNAEKDYYSEVFGGGIGDTPYVLVNSIDETEENVVFHISLIVRNNFLLLL